MKDRCPTDCPIQIQCQAAVELAAEAIDVVDDTYGLMRQLVGQSIKDEAAGAPAMRRIYEGSVPLAQEFKELSSSVIENNQMLAEVYRQNCIGPITMRRYILFGEKVVRCSSLVKLFR